MFQTVKFKLSAKALLILFSLVSTQTLSDVGSLANNQQNNSVSGGVSMGFSVMQTMKKVHQQQLGTLPPTHNQQAISELEQRLSRVETLLNSLIEQQVK